MSTMFIRVNEGFFAEVIGVKPECFESTKVIGNGWRCVIAENGSINCKSIQKCPDGKVHEIRYFINPDGFYKLTLKIPNQKVRVLRKGFISRRGLCDGFIGLVDGKIDERYAFFRHEAFQNFLDENGIEIIKIQDPNTIYCVSKEDESESTVPLLYTDGNVKEIFDGNNDRVYEICNATWVINEHSKKRIRGIDQKRVLYTLERNISKLNLKKAKSW